MADRLAFVIGVGSHLDSSLPAAAHAESDANAFARALERLGFQRDHQVVLLGSQATKTAIESRLRKLLKTPTTAETLYVFYAGHGFHIDGQDYLTTYDSQADDLAETSVPLRTLLEALGGSSCSHVALFLDARAAAGREPLSLTPPRELVAKTPAAACFVSCREGETSHTSGALKAGIWTHHVIEALGGKAPLALEAGRFLTAQSLQDHVCLEVPRTLRSTFREAPAQTPVLFVADDQRFVVADVGSLVDESQPTADPRLAPLKRGSLRNETTMKVKSLSGYRKFHRLPDRVNAGSRKFVSDLAAEDVKSDVDTTYASVREQIGYKRRDVEGSADRGTGFVRTPDFEYSVSVDLADDDPTTVIWRREVAGIRNPEVVLGRPFQQVFGEVFDTLVFEFTRPFDLEAWVDHIEDAMPAGVKLRTASDCSRCDVSVAGFTGVIRLYRDRVEIQGRKTPSSKGLVEAFLHFQDLFAGRRDLQELPLLGG
jgi:hypothetical protein